MSIIIKFTLRNIKEKKFRTFLILISIMLSSALFFASLAISTTAEDMVIQQVKKYFGSADIMVTAGRAMKTSFFSPSVLDDYKDKVKYIVGIVDGGGEYRHKNETIQVSLQGINLDDLQKMNPIIVDKEYNLKPFKGQKAIIGKNMADKYNLKLGDPLEIKIGGGVKRFIISAISQPVGPFAANGGQSTYIVVPRDTLASYYGGRGKVVCLYIGLNNSEMQEQMVDELSKAYPLYRVDSTIPREQLKRETQQISSVFLVIVMFVIIMSIFIIYTSYKVITTERLPIIGTFRSIGATKKMTNRVMKLESIIYGIIGGILGDILGIGILHLMINRLLSMSPDMQNGGSIVHFTFNQLIAAFILGVALAFLSSLVPITKASKVPLKDIILSNLGEESVKKKKSKVVIGIIFLAFGIAGPYVTPESMRMLVNIICMFLLVPGVVLLVPYITNGFLKIFTKFYDHIFGNEGILAAQNLKDNKSNINNIVLLGISIAVVLMITILSDSIAKDTVDYFKDCKYDIQVWTWPQNRTTESKLLSVDGVESTYGIYGKYDTEVVNKDMKIHVIRNADADKHLDYFDLITKEKEPEKLLKELTKERNIIITYTLRDENQIQKGDYLKLKTNKGVIPYKVIGFFDSDNFNGSFAFIGNRYIKSDMGTTQYNQLYVKTNKDPEKVAENIREKLKKQNPWVETMKQLEQQNIEGNKMILGIFQGFGILALVIGVFGVFNNLIINFIERKRSLAILRSVGMNKKQGIKMMFVEAFTGGLIGSLVGIGLGAVLVWAVCRVLESLGGSMHNFIHVSGTTLIGALLTGIVITIVASISPGLKSSKLNIIDSIKYE